MCPSGYPVPRDAAVARLVALLDEDRREAFEERAGILEFDARLPRDEAERQALIQTLARYGFPASPELCLIEVRVGDRTRWLLGPDDAPTRARLAGLGASVVSRAEPVSVLRRHFGGLAVLARVP